MLHCLHQHSFCGLEGGLASKQLTRDGGRRGETNTEKGQQVQVVTVDQQTEAKRTHFGNPASFNLQGHCVS